MNNADDLLKLIIDKIKHEEKEVKVFLKNKRNHCSDEISFGEGQKDILDKIKNILSLK